MIALETDEQTLSKGEGTGFQALAPSPCIFPDLLREKHPRHDFADSGVEVEWEKARSRKTDD